MSGCKAVAEPDRLSSRSGASCDLSLDNPRNDLFEKMLVGRVLEIREEKRILVKRCAREAIGNLPRVLDTATLHHQLVHPADLRCSAFLASAAQQRAQALAFLFG